MDDTSLEYNIKRYKSWEDFVECLIDSYESLPIAETVELKSIRSDIIEYVNHLINVIVPAIEFHIVQDFCSQIIHEILKISEKLRESSSNASVSLGTFSLRTIFEKLKCKCDEKIKEQPIEDDAICELIDLESSEYDSTVSEFEPTGDSWKCVEPIDFRSKSVNINEFLSVHSYGKLFVDDILESAVFRIRRTRLAEDSICPCSISSIHQLPTLKIKEFTLERGNKYIADFVSLWEKKPGWLFCVDPVSKSGDSCCENYIYEVKWSIPTKCYPIPQAVASVFFSMEVSRIIPEACPVKTTYSFEGQRRSYTLEDSIQHDVFIADILETKLNFFKTIKFEHVDVIRNCI